MRTEDELIDALRQAADVAPEPDLLAGVRTLRRRRARRRTQVLAAAAVVAAVATTVAARGVLLRGGGEDVAAVTDPAVTVTLPVSSASPEVTVTLTVPVKSPKPYETQVHRFKRVSAKKAWPMAVFTMPGQNSDGWKYRPLTGISATEVLLYAESSFEKAGKIEIYDTGAGRAEVLTDIPTTPGFERYIPQAADLDDRHVVWYANATRADGALEVEFWKVPRSGGTPERFGALTGEAAKGVDEMALAGDRVVWSKAEGGVYAMPLTGGEPVPLAGGQRLRLADWPWASDLGKYGGPEEFDRNQSKVVNLETGEAREVSAPEGVKGWRCGGVWCYGRGDDGSIVQRVDGGPVRELPGLDVSSPFAEYPIKDRFLQAGGGMIYDLETGVLATLDTKATWSGTGVSSEPSTIIYGDAGKGRYNVLNLAAVPPAQ